MWRKLICNLFHRQYWKYMNYRRGYVGYVIWSLWCRKCNRHWYKEQET